MNDQQKPTSINQPFLPEGKTGFSTTGVGKFCRQDNRIRVMPKEKFKQTELLVRMKPLTFQGIKFDESLSTFPPFFLKRCLGISQKSEQVLFFSLLLRHFSLQSFQSATKPIMLARMSGSLKRQHFLWSFPTIPPRNNSNNRFNPGIVFVSEILAIRFHSPIVEGFGSRVQWLC